jgi:predicted nucleic acid-binding protein
MAQRRKRITSRDIGKIMGQLRRLPVIIEAVPDLKGWETFVMLAQEHGLSTYDAAYLELAIRLKIPLATKAAQLFKAARKMGLTPLP